MVNMDTPPGSLDSQLPGFISSWFCIFCAVPVDIDYELARGARGEYGLNHKSIRSDDDERFGIRFFWGKGVVLLFLPINNGK